MYIFYINIKEIVFRIVADWFFWLSLILTSYFFLSMFILSDSYLAMPVDDAFIYFQYGRQMADGHWFQFNTGDATSTGATSYLYVIVLSLAYLFGFGSDSLGLSIIYFVFMQGFILLYISTIFLRKIASELFHPRIGNWLAVLFLFQGAILNLWFNGLETPWTLLLIIITCYYFIKESRDINSVYPYIKTLMSAGLLSWCRPELYPVFLLILLIVIYQCIRKQVVYYKIDVKWFIHLLNPLNILIYILPVLLATTPYLLNIYLSGHLASNTAMSKSQIYQGIDISWMDIFHRAIDYFNYILKNVLGSFDGTRGNYLGSAYGFVAMYFAPFTLLFFIFGAFVNIGKEIHSRNIGFYSFLTVAIIAFILVQAITMPLDIHWNRYLAPIYPVFIIGLVAGIWNLSNWIKNHQSSVFLGISLFFLIVNILSTIYFGRIYGLNCREIRWQQMTLANWSMDRDPNGYLLPHEIRQPINDLETNWVIDRINPLAKRNPIPYGSRLGVNDAGAIKYMTNHYIYDFQGLVTTSAVEGKASGGGSIWEAWQELPDEKKPDWMILINHWYPEEFYKDHEKVLEHNINAIGVASSISGNPLTVYKVNQNVFEYADTLSEEFYSSHSQLQMIDEIDVGYIPSEKKVGYHCSCNWPVALMRMEINKEKIIMDGFRGIYDQNPFAFPDALWDKYSNDPLPFRHRYSIPPTPHESFTLNGVDPERDLWIVRRKIPAVIWSVFINNEFDNMWYCNHTDQFQSSSQTELECIYHLPKEKIKQFSALTHSENTTESESDKIQLNILIQGQTRSNWDSAHFWIFQ